MHRFARLLAAAALAATTCIAQAHTPEDAKSMLDKAVALFKAKGKDNAIKELNAGGSWKQGELYVVAVQFDGTMLAHSSNDKMPGKNMLEAKDATGKPFVQETIAAVKSKGAGEVQMRWANPVTKQIGDAVMFSKGVPGESIYVGAVVFK